MTRRPKLTLICAILAATLASGCQTTPEPAPEPAVRVVERLVPQPTPCPALVAVLMDALEYPDTDEALREATNLAIAVQLLMQGRELRTQRESEYEAAARGCNF